jgi:transcriptional regulator with PAS, ATPase and Fis domain
LESELFGHEGGSFTGSTRHGKPGLIELAHRGTLFFDEIGELPLDLQVKLLHVLQDRAVMRVGGTRLNAVDFRVLAATNCDLDEMIAKRTFRSDLYYRLNVVPIDIPPLRDRREDIEPLLDEALQYCNTTYHCAKQLDDQARLALVRYDWPGNVRELRNLVERLAIMSPHDIIREVDLPDFHARTAGSSVETGLRASVMTYEYALITAAIEQFGTTRAAAKHLGISQSTLVRKIGVHRRSAASRSRRVVAPDR